MNNKSVRLKIKSGDTVRILSGKDKGKTGKVIKVIPKIGKLVVENVNLHTKFERSKKPEKKVKKLHSLAAWQYLRLCL